MKMMWKGIKNYFSLSPKREQNVPWEEMDINLGELFQDKTLQQEYCQKGFLKIRDVATNILPKLQDEVNQIPISNAAFHYSTMIKSIEESVAMHHRLSPIIHQEFADCFFKNYQLYSSTFLIKPAHNQSEMDLHQDWSFTDERLSSAITIWIPLHDVEIENGCVFILPGTHRIKHSFRSHTLATTRIKRSSEIEPYIQSATLKKGDILLFNPATFHGSYSNNTSQDRIAFAITLMPKSTSLIYADNINNEYIDLHYFEEDDIIRQINTIVIDQPVSSQRKETISYIEPKITLNEILSFIKNDYVFKNFK